MHGEAVFSHYTPHTVSETHSLAAVGLHQSQRLRLFCLPLLSYFSLEKYQTATTNKLCLQEPSEPFIIVILQPNVVKVCLCVPIDML